MGTTAMAAAMVAAIAPTSQAQIRTAPPPMFGNSAIAVQFNPDPFQLRGISGGEIAAEAVAGRLETETGPCLGYVGEQPDHRITLNSFFDYLSLEVISAGDTTLVVKGPGGTWCSDNLSRQNPAIAGQWMPGEYQIWVGSVNPTQYSTYDMLLSEVR